MGKSHTFTLISVLIVALQERVRTLNKLEQADNENGIGKSQNSISNCAAP